MEITIFDAEYKLMELIWETGPINSTQLFKLCNERLGWKKSTTYTNIKRLSERNILENKNTIVKALISKEDAIVRASKDHLNKFYDGSFKFLFASFLQRDELTSEEIEEIQKLLNDKKDK